MLFDRFKMVDMRSRWWASEASEPVAMSRSSWRLPTTRCSSRSKRHAARCSNSSRAVRAVAHNGQRVVVGQRLMQSASDIFLGWVARTAGRDFYVRQLRDMKVSAGRRSPDPAGDAGVCQRCAVCAGPGSRQGRGCGDDRRVSRAATTISTRRSETTPSPMPIRSSATMRPSWQPSATAG